MPIFDTTRDDIETFTVIANPARTFSSGAAGVEGGVFVVARRSTAQKDSAPASSFVDSIHDDSDLASLLTSVQQAGFAARQTSGSFVKHVDAYLSASNQKSVSAANRAVVDIVRIEPSVEFDSDHLKKLTAKDLLCSWHRPSSPSADWSYVNYHSLNFFTASSVSEAYLGYPNIPGGPRHDGYVTGCYSLSGAFTFDFSINPRYQQDKPNADFRAGTIFHLSSSYALSLVSGSARDQNGRAVGFRLQLQLSHSADVQPSRAVVGAPQCDLVFMSDDNSLMHNSWHRCVVRWGTRSINDGSGSFIIDGIERGTFSIPSGTIAPRTFTNAADPGMLVVGNFMDGANSGSNEIARVFGPSVSSIFGVKQLWPVDAQGAVVYTTAHQLNAELHDLSIWRRYRSNAELAALGAHAPEAFGADVAFYAPPFFRQASPIRRSLGGTMGGVMVSPYAACDGTTEDPANSLLRLACNGHLINIENFVLDLANENQPIPVGTTFEQPIPLSNATSANDVLYADSRACRRNTLIMPCDDGAWEPSFSLVGSCLTGSRHADSRGRASPPLVSLVGLADQSSLLFGAAPDEGSSTQAAMIGNLLGITPESFTADPGPAMNSRFAQIKSSIDARTFSPELMRAVPTAVFHRTRDDSGSAVMFDVSNIFYGTRILPGSLALSEAAVAGSSGACRMMLRDDGHGGIFRADSRSTWAQWASVGTVFYEEGLIVLLSPHLAMFGRDGFTVSFKGERRIHVMRIDAFAPANELNSSSNPAYAALPPTERPNDPDSSFVYLTGINFHDENLNVVARTQLAQPIMKRPGERIAFKVKIDW